MSDLIKLLLPNLPAIIGILLSAALGIIVLFKYKQLKDWLSIVGVLINMVEIIDENIKDIVGDKKMAVMKRIKQSINNSLKPEDKQKLDALLKAKGYMQ